MGDPSLDEALILLPRSSGLEGGILQIFSGNILGIGVGLLYESNMTLKRLLLAVHDDREASLLCTLDLLNTTCHYITRLQELIHPATLGVIDAALIDTGLQTIVEATESKTWAGLATLVFTIVHNAAHSRSDDHALLEGLPGLFNKHVEQAVKRGISICEPSIHAWVLHGRL